MTARCFRGHEYQLQLIATFCSEVAIDGASGDRDLQIRSGGNDLVARSMWISHHDAPDVLVRKGGDIAACWLSRCAITAKTAHPQWPQYRGVTGMRRKARRRVIC
jgi:hypothetical protein